MIDSKALRTKRQISGLPIVGNIKAGSNGELTFKVTIKPELLDPVMGLVQLFSSELRRSMRTRDFWRDQAMKEKIDYENGVIDFKRRKRIALSVYRRTGSAALAARAGNWAITDVRMFVHDAEISRRRAARDARNRRIFNLRASGMPCRRIAAQYGITASQVSRIANSAAELRA